MMAPTLPRLRLALSLGALGFAGFVATAWAQQPSEVLRRAERDPKAPANAAARRLPSRTGPPSARWLGQDGHDLAGPSSTLAPSDVQDIHVRLSGLPADRTIAFASVQPLGGGEWLYRGPHGPWAAAIVREPGSPTADMYLEPYQAETGRPMIVLLRFQEGGELSLDFQGGKADPNLRMPAAAMRVKWLGQDRHDHTTSGPSVGPDGLQDVHLAMSKLSPHVEVRSITVSVENAKKLAWQFGTNPKELGNAEFARDAQHPSQGDLFFTPAPDLAGKTLEILVEYANGKSDRARVKAGRADPSLAMPRPAPVTFLPNDIKARWIGQDGRDVQGPGAVHVALEGLPRGRRVVAAALSDSVRGHWAVRLDERTPFSAEPSASPLGFNGSVDGSRVDLLFSPVRDEKGATMLLRLVFQDGKSTLVRFPGGACDPGRRAGVGPLEASTKARPGDNLHDLVNRFGKITLTRGTYPLSQPLVLNRPVTLTAEPGATLLFTQQPSDAPWVAAIAILAGHTTLDAFAVRFSGPVRWVPDLSFGPGVIRTLDGAPVPIVHKTDVNLTRLDLQAPPAAGPGPWEEAVGLARLLGTEGGRIEENLLRGGPIELFGGPWTIKGNEYLGTPEGTSSPAVFACHDPFDLIVKGNVARSVAPAGKTWRFLVLTGSGARDVIEGNRVEGIGPRDNDTIPNANAPEIVLTEGYRLHFEGKPTTVSDDGRLIQIPPPQGGPASTGDALAVLSGPEAGTWRRIVQALDATTYLIDPPLPKGDLAISIATGFVEETFADNTIETRGGSVAANLVLAGNHFGTRVRNNHLIGGGEAYKLTATPTELPGPWGWSHAPFVGVVIEGNTIEDSLRGGSLNVEHSSATKSSRGRVYLSATLKDNVGVWSEAFLRARPLAKPGERLAFSIGHPEASDPGEALVTESGTRLRVPPGTRPGAAMRIYAARVNGKAVRERGVVLPQSEPLTRRASDAPREPRR
jgi:hypothetical protein